VIGNFGIGAGVEQQADNLDIYRSAVTENDCFQQGGPAQVVDVVNIDSSQEASGLVREVVFSKLIQ